jgi:UDP-N-acetylglucosamine acyltransferase
MKQTRIHPTALVDPKAELDYEVEVGPYAIIEDNVQIGRGVVIGPRALIAWGSRLAEDVKVHHCATLGTAPQDLKFGGEESVLKIGTGTVIREFATLNRGTEWSHETVVGKNCLLMAYSHVAHDCHLGDNVIIANSVQMAGHVFIHNHAIVSGNTVIHQFVRIGEHSMIGGGLRVPQDVVPYALMGGYPLTVKGLNLVGLKRRGFSTDRLKPLKEAYKFLFFSNLNTTQAMQKILAEVEQTEEVKKMVEMVESSERGIVK